MILNAIFSVLYLYVLSYIFCLENLNDKCTNYFELSLDMNILIFIILTTVNLLSRVEETKTQIVNCSILDLCFF